MTNLTRRSLLAGAAATTALAATSLRAQVDMVQAPVDLTGTSILITGCSSGFGKLGAEHYARLGARVFATMRNMPRPEADELRDLAITEELDLFVIEIDVQDDESVMAGVIEAERLNGGPLDVLVNNAGIGLSGPIEVQDMEATQMMFDINVFGCHRMARAVLPGMRAKGGGRIFQMSSQLGRVIAPNTGHYSPAKFALEAMSEAMAYELVPHNIDVTIVEPGGYPTQVWINRNRYASELKSRARPIHTAGYPEAVERMGTEDGSGRSADPMDIPRLIAKTIAMPKGSGPLRTPVSGSAIPQLAINQTTRDTQLAWLGNSGYGPMIKAVHGG